MRPETEISKKTDGCILRVIETIPCCRVRMKSGKRRMVAVRREEDENSAREITFGQNRPAAGLSALHGSHSTHSIKSTSAGLSTFALPSVALCCVAAHPPLAEAGFRRTSRPFIPRRVPPFLLHNTSLNHVRCRSWAFIRAIRNEQGDGIQQPSRWDRLW